MMGLVENWFFTVTYSLIIRFPFIIGVILYKYDDNIKT